jgi:hypothetical protein
VAVFVAAVARVAAFLAFAAGFADLEALEALEDFSSPTGLAAVFFFEPSFLGAMMKC